MLHVNVCLLFLGNVFVLEVSAVSDVLLSSACVFHVHQVRIALQMEDGSRLQGSFSCGQSLWELITHFPQIRCVLNMYFC